MVAKFIELVKRRQYDIFLGICIVLISLISYNLGKINSIKKGEIKITEGANIYQTAPWPEPGSNEKEIKTAESLVSPTPKLTPKPIDLRVVISKKSSSKTYHFTWCPGFKQIKEENKVWFNSAKEAENAGYTLAGNCSR